MYTMAKAKARPNLAEITKHGNFYDMLSGTMEAPAGHQQVQGFLDYFLQAQKPSQQEFEDTRENLWRTPLRAGEHAQNYIGEHAQKIIAQVGINPAFVLGKLEQSTLIQLAQPHLGDAAYQGRIVTLEKGNIADTRSTTIGLYKTEGAQRVAHGLSTSDLKDALSNYVTRETGGYMVKNLGLNLKTGKIDTGKTAKLIAGHIKTDNDKLKAGLIYATKK